jgi:hypothetical protein
MVNQSNSGGYMISFDTFANFASSMDTGAAGMNIIIPARCSSHKTLFTVSRSIFRRSNLFGDTGQRYYSIGGTKLSSTPIKTNTKVVAELLQGLACVRRSKSHPSHHPGILDIRPR